MFGSRDEREVSVFIFSEIFLLWSSSRAISNIYLGRVLEHLIFDDVRHLCLR